MVRVALRQGLTAVHVIEAHRRESRRSQLSDVSQEPDLGRCGANRRIRIVVNELQTQIAVGVVGRRDRELVLHRRAGRHDDGSVDRIARSVRQALNAARRVPTEVARTDLVTLRRLEARVVDDDDVGIPGHRAIRSAAAVPLIREHSLHERRRED